MAHEVLLSIAEQPTYGVELLERLEARTGGAVRLNAGSLYRLLAQLVDEGLVQPVEEGAAESGGPGAPRKVYAVTEAGRRRLREEAARQAALLERARRLRLTGEAGG